MAEILNSTPAPESITLKITKEVKVNTEKDAQHYIESLREDAKEKGYLVGAAGYTYKQKKKKGEIVGEGYLVKTTELYNEFWDDLPEEV